MVVVKHPLLVVGTFITALVTSCRALIPSASVDFGLGVNINKNVNRNPFASECDDAEIVCDCGKQGERSVSLFVPQCPYISRWKTKCRPCDKKEPEDICPKFQNCLQCHLDGGDQCASCPPAKFGNWCENDCLCQNGAECDRSGNCLCPPEFQGQRCERRKGCTEPHMAAPPLQETRQPPRNPMTIIYSCPVDYELRGSSVITCLSDGRWSGPPPQCIRKCPILSAPANGRVEYTSNDLVEGVTAIVRCSESYSLIGDHTLRCLSGGVWNSALPSCKQMTFCPEPASIPNSVRVVESSLGNRNSGPFSETTKISYSCLDDYEQMGEDVIACLSDGKWSDEPGICLKVSSAVANCQTHGEDVVAETGIRIRLWCPPECANGIPLIWGTSIYRKASSVCPAAVHAGIITNSGGIIDVINNGEYSHFVGSIMNNVHSQSFDEKDESFRFSRVPPLIISKGNGDCPRSLERLNEMCVHASNKKRNEKEAEAICRNLGLRLPFPESEEEQKSLAEFLKGKNILKIWTGKTLNSSETIAVDEELNGIVSGNTQTIEDQCELATVSGDSFEKEAADCQLKNNFLCAHGSHTRSLASCEDPGPLTNGKETDVGKIGNAFYIGASIEYKCESLHYMKGEKVIHCTSNGTWTGSKPTCIRVNTCDSPPVPTGGLVNYLPPLRLSGNQRSADVRNAISTSRMARIPVGMAAPPPAPLSGNTLSAAEEEENENIPLPPGVHRVGTRAMYDCESRYYQLIGSRTRRCETRGKWSGRPPTCIPVCGRSDSPRSPFIVNGNASDIGQWPWQAAIARWLPDYNRWFVLCGGSLLNERWVITAAHCVTYAATTMPIDPDKFQVYLGKYHRMDTKDDEYVQVKKVLEIHIHPDYDPNLFDADIGLLQVETPVQFNSRVQPVCLPTDQSARDNLKEGRSGVVTGWGMNENETYSETLQQAVLPVVSHETCEQGYLDSKLPLTVTENMFCAGFARGQSDACSGDSGGPMVFLDETAKDKRWVLEGIVSWGSPSGCGHENQYGGYTTVSKFLDWIHLFF